MKSIKKPLSTGEVAKYCRVSAVTVFNWIKAGKIKHHATAGGQYRVERADLVDFLNKYGMPVPATLLSGDKHKVLAVDDDSAVLEFVVAALKTEEGSIELDTAEDGYIACMKIGAQQPDLVLLDLSMPKIDGMQVVKKLREHESTKSTEVVVLTGHCDVQQREKLKSLGVKQILSKPIKSEELRSVVRKVLKIS